mmetsp:Transcript_5572/g.9565  ORF Transcript_5572/g.9565 Transcript_5572/m.9565 type:complete len:386 (-) Transcript_5572:608-1765(-)
MSGPGKKFVPLAYFTPKIRSKYINIGILRFLCRYQFEVVLLLRSLSKQSEHFLDQYAHEFMDSFEVYNISFTASLVTEAHQKLESAEVQRRKRFLGQLKAFQKLQRIYDFRDKFDVSLDLQILKFRRGETYLEQETERICIDCILQNARNFKSIKFTVNENPDSKMTYEQSLMMNPATDYINIFLNDLTETLKNDREYGGLYGSSIDPQELVLHQIDQKYLHFFIASNYWADQEKRSSYFKSESSENSDAFQLELMSPITFDRKAIPLSVSSIKKLELYKCYLDVLNFRQLSTFLMYSMELRELDLTYVLKSVGKDVPDEFTKLLGNAVKFQLGSTLEKLCLANNFFKDHTLMVLVNDSLQRMKALKHIDLSSNGLTDEGISFFL